MVIKSLKKSDWCDDDLDKITTKITIGCRKYFRHTIVSSFKSLDQNSVSIFENPPREIDEDEEDEEDYEEELELVFIEICKDLIVVWTYFEGPNVIGKFKVFKVGEEKRLSRAVVKKLDDYFSTKGLAK